jgi:hypothetical protein
MSTQSNRNFLDESEGARDFLRKKDSITRGKAIALLTIKLVCNIFLDLFRILFIFWFKFSKSGCVVLFASNNNHKKNVEKYSPILSKALNTIKIKNSRTLATIPQSVISINGLYNIFFNEDFILPLYSHLDIDEASYKNINPYISVMINFIGCKLAILSREDSIPFIEVALAAQNNNIKLLIFEHGVLTRFYKSFETSEKTAHVYSSEENFNKREPLASRVFKSRSPLYGIYQSIDSLRKKNTNTQKEILIADTYNIRHCLLDLAYLLEKNNSVKIRLHPGTELNIGKFRSNIDKISAMARAKLVITGISGFSLESAFSNIPTIILFSRDDVWGNQTLKVYEGLPHVQIVELTDFFKTPDKFISLTADGGDKLLEFQQRTGYFVENESMQSLNNFIDNEI